MKHKTPFAAPRFYLKNQRCIIRRPRCSQVWVTMFALTILVFAETGVQAGVKTETFDNAATAAANGWVELGSRENGQDFGFSDTTFVGGPAGEAGGVVKRDAIRAAYVDVFGGTRLTLDDHISASGKIIVPGPYGGNLGHLVGHSDSKRAGQSLVQANQMGLLVATSGTRFNVHLSLANDIRRESVIVLPTLTPTTVYDWEYAYDPDGGTTGNGALTVTVVGDGVTNTGVYELTVEDRAAGAEYDCFGLTSRALPSSAATGTAYMDDVSYTVPDDYLYKGEPMIKVQPQSITVAAGQDVEFAVLAIGGGLSYRWRANGVNLTDATNSTLLLPQVPPGPPIAYSVVVSNSFGSTTSTDAILTVMSAPVITAQPQNVTLLSGGTATFSVAALGGDLSYQWRVNGVPINGATDSTFAVSNVVPDLPAAYSVTITNLHGATNSANAILTVNATNMFDTAVMTNIWDVLPGDRFYLTASGNTARGLAYHALSASVIVASRAGGNVVVSLDADTGAEQHFMDTTLVSGGTLAMNLLGVAEDGAIYLANLTANAATTPYTIYRWATNDPWLPPTIAFSGDPGGMTFPGLRWGDSLTVRGGGTDTQILISPGSVGGDSTNAVAILRTADGLDFQNAIPPTMIQITNAQTGFASLGLAFGPGANTFFAKTLNAPLTLVEFDLGSQIGYIKQSYSFGAVPRSVTAIAAETSRSLLAALAVETPDNARLYDIADSNRDPGLLDQEAFQVDNANTTAGGPGALAFGPNQLFILNNNNGLKAFVLNSGYLAPSPFSLGAELTTGPALVLSWPTESGRLYQAWARNSVNDPGWGLIGLPVPGTGGLVSVTNQAPGVPARFYRVQGQ